MTDFGLAGAQLIFENRETDWLSTDYRNQINRVVNKYLIILDKLFLLIYNFTLL